MELVRVDKATVVWSHTPRRSRVSRVLDHATAVGGVGGRVLCSDKARGVVRCTVALLHNHPATPRPVVSNIPLRFAFLC